MVLLSEVEDISADEQTCKFLFDFIKGNIAKIDDYDIQLINSYRIKNNLKPLSKLDIFSYIEDIKEIVINTK